VAGNYTPQYPWLWGLLGYLFGNEGVRKVMEGSRSAEVLAEQMLASAHELVLCGWCQGMSAQDELGRAIEPSSAFARSWSAPGALERVWLRTLGGGDVVLVAFERANLALTAAIKDVPQHWNDAAERTKEEVLDALLAAAALLKAEPAEPAASLVEDLLDDLERYQAIPDDLFENPAPS
jgi:hypothetical protein